MFIVIVLDLKYYNAKRVLHIKRIMYILLWFDII